MHVYTVVVFRLDNVAKQKVARTDKEKPVKIDADKLQEYLEIARRTHPLATSIIEKICEQHGSHGSIWQWFAACHKTSDDTMAWARGINDKFAPTPDPHFAGVPDVQSWTTGLAIARPYHFDWCEDCGYSLPSFADMLCMISLILGKTFKTNPSLAGTEALVARPKNGSELASVIFKPTDDAPELYPNLPIGSVSLVKGKNDFMLP